MAQLQTVINSLFLLGNRQDGVPPENGSALVFESLIEMRIAFIDLW